jgi:hypothetical protein
MPGKLNGRRIAVLATNRPPFCAKMIEEFGEYRRSRTA